MSDENARTGSGLPKSRPSRGGATPSSGLPKKPTPLPTARPGLPAPSATPSSLPSKPVTQPVQQQPVTPGQPAPSLPAQPQQSITPAQPTVPAQQPQYEQQSQQPQVQHYPPQGSQHTEEEEDSGRKGKGRKSKGKSSKKSNSGGDPRTNALAVRFIIIGLLSLLVILGVKSAILPAQPPSADEIAYDVQQSLNMTAFPADQAQGFVQSFTKAYLTISEGTPEDTSAFTGDDSIMRTAVTYPSTFTQSIVDGPYIFGVRYLNDYSAVFTVGSKVDSGDWIYLAINVLYNSESRSLVIPSAPSIASQPTLSTIPMELAYQADDEATESATNTVTSFFEAWVTSSEEGLSVLLSTSADARAHKGLNNLVSFNGLTEFNVFVADETMGGIRHARAKVSLTRGGGESITTYESSYDLLLIHSASDDKWYVQDILPTQFEVDVEAVSAE